MGLFKNWSYPRVTSARTMIPDALLVSMFYPTSGCCIDLVRSYLQSMPLQPSGPTKIETRLLSHLQVWDQPTKTTSKSSSMSICTKMKKSATYSMAKVFLTWGMTKTVGSGSEPRKMISSFCRQASIIGSPQTPGMCAPLFSVPQSVQVLMNRFSISK